jgi:hypothetical protein
MTRSRLTQMTLAFMICAVLAAACSGGTTQPAAQPNVPPATATAHQATPVPAAHPATQLPAIQPVAAKPPAAHPAPTQTSKAPTAASQAAAQPGTPTAQSDASGDAADQALQQLNKNLSSVDTVADVNNPADGAASQSLDQLSKGLSSTDTLNDLSK